MPKRFLAQSGSKCHPGHPKCPNSLESLRDTKASLRHCLLQTESTVLLLIHPLWPSLPMTATSLSSPGCSLFPIFTILPSYSFSLPTHSSFFSLLFPPLHLSHSSCDNDFHSYLYPPTKFLYLPASSPLHSIPRSRFPWSHLSSVGKLRKQIFSLKGPTWSLHQHNI